LVASFFLGRVLFEFPVGLLSDYLGRRLIMRSAVLLFTVSTAAYALSTDPTIMVILRMLQGVSASAFAVGSQAYINDRTPRECRGLANGVVSSAINGGVIVGPLLAGILSQAYSIKAPFWAGGALGAACFFLMLTIPPLGLPREQRITVGIESRLKSIKRAFEPVFSLPSFSMSLVHFLQWMGIAIFLTIAPIFTAETLSWDAGVVALAFAASGTVSALASPLLGHLSDRSGRIWVMAAGLAVSALESLLVLLHPGSALTIIAFAIGGLGAPAYFNSFLSLIGDVTRPRERGAVTGFVGSFGEWGSIIGSGLITPLLWHNINSQAPLVFDVLVFFATALLVIVARRPLQRQIGSE
jgi:MFS family permease